jgi:serine/threonine protein kinase
MMKERAVSQLQTGTRISEYLLDQQIGRGSFGQVWKAHHHIWHEEIVAIKVPTDSQYVRNLQKEGSTIHGLKHPNIVRAIGLDPYAETPYLVMEYVDGPALRQLIGEYPKGMPAAVVQRIVVGILRALAHAHEHGVIHRDIKPENILIHRGKSKAAEEIEIDDVKVTDFGLGRAGQITTTSILQSGSLLSEEGRSISGTLAYMAPEQRDQGETDARTDLYAVGIVLFELLCGGRPSGSDMPSQMREGLPPWVDPVYARLYTRRERRFPGAVEALKAIESANAPPIIGAAGLPTAAGEREADREPACSSCGAAVEVGDNFCTTCGTQLVGRVRRCSRCEAFPAPEDRFCVLCGTRLPASGA